MTKLKIEKSTEEKVFTIGREMLEVQGGTGNWDCDPYMHGLYNGMEFMLSLIEDREPDFRDAPEKWKRRNWIQNLIWKLTPNKVMSAQGVNK